MRQNALREVAARHRSFFSLDWLSKRGRCDSRTIYNQIQDAIRYENRTNLSRKVYHGTARSKSVAQSPQWNETLLVITYDEHGGCYDHVAPPGNAVPPDGLPVSSPTITNYCSKTAQKID